MGIRTVGAVPCEKLWHHHLSLGGADGCIGALSGRNAGAGSRTASVLAPAARQQLGVDVRLEVALQTPEMAATEVIARTNLKYMYWAMAQQLTHHTVNGCNFKPGDLVGTGTISGPTEDSFGSLLELTWAGSKEDLNIKNIQRTVLMMGRSQDAIQDVPCGNTVGLVGIDQYLLKTGTLTDIEDAHNIADMKYSVSPVVKVAVKVKDGKDLPKLVEGMKKLSKSDPLVVCTTEESGEHVIAGCGELHVEICLKDLKEEYAQCDLVISDPVVGYRETVTADSKTALAKSPNKHNRLYLVATPMSEELAAEIEKGPAGPKADPKDRVKLLREKFDWDDNEARKIWCWGPETDGANVVVDTTVAIQYLLEIKEHVNSAFQWCTKEGPLCEENMRGIRFNLTDVTLHTDSIHRGAGQIMPPTRRGCFAAEMMGKPTLQEPVFLVEIVCPQEAMSGVYGCMNMRRGCVFEENPREGTPLVQSRSYLPVSESFGFVAALRQATSGQAFPQCVFSHWDSMPGDCIEAGKMQELALAVRKRKNIKVEIPALGDYLDKL